MSNFLVDKLGIQNRLFRDAVIIFTVGLLLFTIGLSQQEFINFEARFALFAKDMLLHGPRLFPTISGHAYPDYTSTSTFFIYLSSLPLGGLSRFSAIFPNAIFSAITLAFIYLIAAPHSRQWGFCAVLFCLFTVFFINNARSIAMDQMIMAISTLSFYLVYSQDVLIKSKREYWLPILFIVGFLIRGPIGLIVPACVVGVYYLLAQKWKKLALFVLITFILLVILCALLAVAAYHTGGHLFLNRVISMEVGSRIETSQKIPFWFYFKNSFSDYAISFPIATIVTLGCLSRLCRKNPDKRIKLVQYCVVWTLVLLILFSIPDSKKTRYVLSIVPAISLIAATLFVDDKQPRWLYWIRKALSFIFFIFPFIGALLVLLAKNLAEHRFHANVHVHFTAVFIVLLILQIAAIIYGFARQVARKESMWLLSATLAFIAINIMVVEPAKLFIGQSKNFVQLAEARRTADNSPLIFYGLEPDGLAIKYFVNMPHLVTPTYINNAADLTKLPNNTDIVTDKAHYQTLPINIRHQFKIILHGRFGHKHGLLVKKVTQSLNPPNELAP